MTHLTHDYGFGLDWFKDEETNRALFYYDPNPLSQELRRLSDDAFLDHFPPLTAAIAHLHKIGHTVS